MSKNTFFNTRFWQDKFISELDPIEKLLFNYCITSSFLSLCGIYELPIKYISVETGIEKEMIEKIFTRFERKNKIIYNEGWLCVLNYPKYQSYNLPNVKKGLKKEIESVPKELLKHFIDKGYDYKSIANALAIDCQGIVNMEQGKGTRKGNKETKKKHKYGEYNNVLLSDIEKEKIKTKFGLKKAKMLVTEMDEAIEMKGYSYKSHYLAILKWEREDIGSKHFGSSNPLHPRVINELKTNQIRQERILEEQERDKKMKKNNRMNKLMIQSKTLTDSKTIKI